MSAMNKKMCEYVGCTKGIANFKHLCLEHYKEEQKGLIDKCPGCGKYKDKGFDLCVACNKGNPAVNVKGPESKYYVYVLHLKDGEYYVGSTGVLKVRMVQHRDGREYKEMEPKLQYFEIFNSEEI